MKSQSRPKSAGIHQRFTDEEFGYDLARKILSGGLSPQEAKSTLGFEFLLTGEHLESQGNRKSNNNNANRPGSSVRRGDIFDAPDVGYERPEPRADLIRPRLRRRGI